MLWAILTTVICVAITGAVFGNQYGRAKARLELENFRQQLVKIRAELIFNLSSAKTKRAEAVAYHASAVDRAKRLIGEAEFKAANAYKDKEKSIRSIARAVVESHPNNFYIATVLSETLDAVLNESIDRIFEQRNAPKTAAAIKKTFNEHARQWRLEARAYKYQALLYQSLFPKLDEYAEPLEVDRPREPHPSDWLPEEEYRMLTDEEKIARAQRSLDRYVNGPKSNWEVGRDYELYCGYLFRKAGYSVVQNGTTAKLEDLGRDLICTKGNTIIIVQCKFWAQSKEVHEKHIAQLLGTTLSYAVENNFPSVELGNIGSKHTRIIPMFITSTRLSQTARRFADALRVDVRTVNFDPRKTIFPRIKCNIRNEGRIFHLPFDQLYDRGLQLLQLFHRL